MKNPIQSFVFAGTSLVTTYFPHAGARILDFLVRPLVGNRLLSWLFNQNNQRKLRKIQGVQRILVNPDIHIGDAIMAQAVAMSLRDFFPQAEIDFVTNRSVMPLLEANSAISRLLPIYAGGAFPPESELKAVVDLIKHGNYDLCINSNPFLTGPQLAKKAQRVFDVTTHAPTLVRNESNTSEINHFAFQHRQFVHGLLGKKLKPLHKNPFRGVNVSLSDSAIEEASHFLGNFADQGPLVLINTDTASDFTRIPFKIQVDISQWLLKQGASLLVGAGHSKTGWGARLMETLASPEQTKVRLIPANLSLGAYSALGDRCDLFVTGDTGPMHIAAARKVSSSGNYALRNRTALLCVFGATPARMSGYDSFQPGYLPANQEAPSWTVVAGSPCRNITCINKMFKTCPTVRCFEALTLETLIKPLQTALDFRVNK